MPALTTKAPELAAALKVRIGIVRAGDDVNALLASIPAGVDAVYVTPLRFSDAQLRELAQGLQARKLPTFSVVGRSEVEAGVLMTTGGAERDTERLARRVAIMIQRISQGEDPATFEVGFPTSQRLLINMQVARAIGFSPRWQYLADAEQLLTDSGDAQPLTLLGAMRAALDANPALAASRERLGSALDDVNIARSDLLPSLSASAARTRIDEDRASPLTQAEDSTSAGLEFSQVIYSERAWAGYSIAKSLGAAQEQSQRTDMLDTLTDSAVGLSERACAPSRSRKCAGATRRTRAGISRSRACAKRWGSPGAPTTCAGCRSWRATSRRCCRRKRAAARRRPRCCASCTGPRTSPSAPWKSGIDDPLALVANPRTQAFLDTPAKWAAFMEYAVHTALENAPEIKQAEAVLTARQRALSSAGRAFYLPDLALVSNGSKFTDKSGAGSLVGAGRARR